MNLGDVRTLNANAPIGTVIFYVILPRHNPPETIDIDRGNQ